MLTLKLRLALSIGFLTAFTTISLANSLDLNSYADQDIIQRDVAVVGGGSSGVYTAIRLTDYNQSVIVLEKREKLGGHAETYTDPATNTPINLGVVVWGEAKLVTDYFARFNLPLVNVSADPGPDSSQYVDFSNNGILDSFQAPSRDAVEAALAAYENQLDKYPSLQQDFSMSYPVDSDLLLPFGEFVNKFNLSALMYPLTFRINQGYSPLTNLTTLYMLKYLNTNQLGEYKTGTSRTTVHHNSSELYTRAGSYLGPSNVLLNANITSVDRSSNPVQIAVQTPNGAKLILAKKLVIAIPPTLTTLSNFNLTPTEQSLFSQFFANGYSTGVLRNTGLPSNTSIVNFGTNQLFNIPVLPGIIALNGVLGTDFIQVFYGSPTLLPDSQIQSDILSSVTRLQKSLNVTTAQAPEFVAYTNHAPFNLMVDKEAIANGFYEQLYALQGQSNTFWNGAAWQSQDSTVIWQFTETNVLPKILAAL